MNSYQCINITQARQLQQQGVTLIDIRDEISFAEHHVANSHSVYQRFAEFITAHEKTQPVMVLCYHGISSKTVAHYLLEQGIEIVYSVDGGFEAWQNRYPDDIVSMT